MHAHIIITQGYGGTGAQHTLGVALMKLRGASTCGRRVPLVCESSLSSIHSYETHIVFPRVINYGVLTFVNLQSQLLLCPHELQ